MYTAFICRMYVYTSCYSRTCAHARTQRTHGRTHARAHILAESVHVHASAGLDARTHQKRGGVRVYLFKIAFGSERTQLGVPPPSPTSALDLRDRRVLMTSVRCAPYCAATKTTTTTMMMMAFVHFHLESRTIRRACLPTPRVRLVSAARHGDQRRLIVSLA